MAVRIERTDGLVLMSTEELFAEVGRKTGDIVIRMSAEALKKPGAFFHISYQSDVPADVGDSLQGAQP